MSPRDALLLIASDDALIAAIAKRQAEYALMSQASERWVTADAYCKRWNVSKMHLHRHRRYFERNKAIDGSGKSVRYDKFFSPKSGDCIYS
jgi:hypothetical protein